METKSLRDSRHLLEKVGTKEAHLFVEENSHPRLWRLLAEAALQAFGKYRILTNAISYNYCRTTIFILVDLVAAESAFVRCADFAALQLLHKLNTLPTGSILLQAEVAAYFHRFDEAEKMYLDNDRR